MNEYLTPAVCARRLGMTTGFIRGEIHDARLKARIFQREGKRRVYRIQQADFDAYVERYWSDVPRGTETH